MYKHKLAALGIQGGSEEIFKEIFESQTNLVVEFTGCYFLSWHLYSYERDIRLVKLHVNKIYMPH